MPDFTAFDGSDRIPRPGQLQYLRRLDSNWSKFDAFAGILPTGSGKSALSRSIQVATGADILTVSNALVTQYHDDYPHVNMLKGKAHYSCKAGLTCKEWQDCGFDACESCPYQKAKERALDGFATFYNPMSFYYYLLSNRTKGASTIVIDEAHTLPSMMLRLCSKRFKQSEYNFSDKCCNERYFVYWARDQIQRLHSLADRFYKIQEVEKLAKAKQEMEDLAIIVEAIESEPQNYVFYIEKGERESYLNVRPVYPPRFLMDRIVGNKRVIMLSGTLFDYDVADIVGDRKVDFYEQNSPIPVKNRQVFYRPAPFKINYQTDPRQLADYIMSFVRMDRNTMIHSTYSLSQKIAPFLPKHVIVNKQDDKEEKIEEFKRRGGIFLASGCAEGIDFKGDICRINIIPKLMFPDLKDPVVIKRKALQDGQKWYALETVKNLIQAAGRSTRSSDDYSEVFCLDPNFGRLFAQYKQYMPKYFTESIVWTSK